MEPVSRSPFGEPIQNPYAVVPVALPPTLQPVSDGAIIVFGVINLVWAALAVLWLAGCGGVLYYGAVCSGDTGSELMAGVFATLVLAVPALFGVVVYSVAGIGLLRRWRWGYYCHLVGSVLAALTCVGSVYMVVALVLTLRPEFSAAFAPPPAKC